MPLPEPFGPIEIPEGADEMLQAVVAQANDRVSYLSRMVLAAIGTARKPEDVPVSLEDLKPVVEDLDARGKMLIRGSSGGLEALRPPVVEQLLTGGGGNQGVLWQHLDGLPPRDTIQTVVAGDRIRLRSRYIRLSSAAIVTLSTAIALPDGSLVGQRVWIQNVGAFVITIPDDANTNCIGGAVALSTDEVAVAIWDGEEWAVAHLWDQTGGMGGKLVQAVFSETTADVSTTSAIPLDNTPPQVTEGFAAGSLAITPLLSTTKLWHFSICTTSHSAVAGALMTTHVAGVDTTDVRAVQMAVANAAGNDLKPCIVVAHYNHPDLTAVTFNVRLGTNAGGTAFINRQGVGTIWAANLPIWTQIILEVTE